MYIPIHLKPYWWYRYPGVRNKASCVNFLNMCTKDRGGIANTERGNEYLETVFYGIVLLGLIDSSQTVESRTVGYLRDRESEEGGFCDLDVNRPTLFNTYYAVCSLSILDLLTPEIRQRTLRYLQKHIMHGDGAYDRGHAGMSTTSLYWALIVMRCLMCDHSVRREEFIEFCMKCYDPATKLFSPFPGTVPTIQNTYEAIVILKELSALKLVDVEETATALMKRKRRHFYHDDLMKRNTLSSAMWAIGSLNIIGKLDKVGNADVLSHANGIFDAPDSVYSLFCAAHIFAHMVYEEGLVDTEKTRVVTEYGDTASLDSIRDQTVRLQKAGYDISLYNYTDLLKHSTYAIDMKQEFVQVQLREGSNRIPEIEYCDDSIVGMQKAIARVKSEVITSRVVSKRRVRMFGIFNPTGDLAKSQEEHSIVKQYCERSRFLEGDLRIGDQVSAEVLDEVLCNKYGIFYYSGHSNYGSLQLSDGNYDVGRLLERLAESNCQIVILNSCSTYKYVKELFLKSSSNVSESLNVISSINDVSDHMGRMFLVTFLYYYELGMPISEALRYTRKDLSMQAEMHGISWWGYVLFGNPYTVVA